MIDKNINYNKYFLRLVKDFEESTALTPDLNGTEKPELKKNELTISKNNIEEFCKQNSISENVLFLASTALALNKFNFTNKNLIFHENDTIFTTNFENRKISIKDYLLKIENDYKENLKYINFPVDELIKEYSFDPKFYYAFNKDLDYDSFKYKYEFYLSIKENDEKFILSSSYNDQLYSKDYINSFLKSIETILNQFLSGDISKLTLSDIYLVKEQETSPFKEIKTPFFHKRFEKQVEKNPDNIALISNGERLTYSELNKKANKVANGLLNKGIKPKSNILIMFPRNSNMIAAILGVLKAGCAYIPIDLAFPKERIAYIYQNSQADYILAENNDMENSIDINELLNEENDDNPNVDISPNDLAFILYTSGSTGLPKGVMGTHRNMATSATEDPDNIVYEAYTKINKNLAVTTVAFVAFFADFQPLQFGNTIVLANDNEVKNLESLVQLMQKEKPDAFTFTTPSRLKQYFEYEPFVKALSSINHIAMGGEKVSNDILPILLANDMDIYAIYGTTEITGFGALEKATDTNEELTIGTSPFNVITEIRDIDGKLLPAGVMGEIYVGGCGVSKGYYNLDDETKKSFLTINNIPFYRTGDFGVEGPNGKLISKGRIDNQIKLRGLRIEIGEIESNIMNFPNITQTAVTVRKINNNDHLCAYFTAKEQINTNELKKYLQDRLTQYMVPTVFMQLEDMPRTPNGKVLVRKLPKPVLNLELVSPETETEEMLFNMASSVIESAEFGVTDDLYSVGFTSLTLMKLNAVIFEQTNVNLNISKLIDDPTIRNIANEIDNAQEDSDELDKIIESSKNSKYIPLTANQLGVYYECAQNPDEPQYNLPCLIRFDKSIDANKLRESLIKTIESYPYLKTRIVMHGDQLMHKRDDSIEIEEIPIVEVPTISEEEIYNLNFKKFELLGGQLFRAKIYETDDEIILFFDMHHIITDGASVNMLFRSISNAYEGNEIEKETIDGYIHALIEKENENSEEYIASEKYFHDLLTQEVDSTILTPNLNGNPDDGKLKSISKNINPETIRKFCADERISPNVLFMASTILNLNKYTFSDKTLITTIFNGRSNSNYFNTQAFLVKTLPIVSINEDRSITLRQLLSQTDNIWKETLKHLDYPYTKISEEFKLKPEFLYTYNNFDESVITMNGKEYEITRLETLETNYKLTFNINESEDNIELHLVYNDQLYTEQYIKIFLNSIINTMTQFIETDIDQLHINDIELNKNYEIPTLTPVEIPFVHKRFEKQVKLNPNNIALVAEDATLTAYELNEKANKIANALIKKGVTPKSNVLVMLHRNSDLIVSILGILKAGCAYIPIDLEYPQDRINYIYENSQADYIISDDENDNSLNVKELLKETNTENPDVEISPDDLAYMIYTSGSTGNPKGVMISHENIANQVQNPKSQYNSILCLATISFDVSVDDILTSLANGIKLILANDTQIKNIPELIKLIDKEKPELAHLTPSRLASYLEVPEFCKAISCLKCLLLGGEQFSTKVYENFREYSDAIVYNSYGPTETTITSNNKEVIDIHDITVGPPLENYITDVRDIDGKLLPHGVMGELYIGGTGVGKGYYNMPDKTQEAFLKIGDIPYYRSGDYAISRPDGEIEILGRIDNQIKLRGLRIEIGEIETNINKYPSIKQTVVVIKEINNNDHLCAYYTAEEDIDKSDLKEFLKDKLTKYMIPTAYMQLDEMPQTPNGKTDLKALPEPKLDLENIKPENKIEEKLFEIATDLAKTNQFGVTDDLYAIGFTSLILMKFNSQIYAAMGVNLDISILFNEPTIRKIASEIKDSDKASDLEEFTKLADELEYFPLTDNQIGIYYECIQNPDVIKYTMPTLLRFDKGIEAEKLKDSIIKTVEAHPYLKTRIITTEDGSLKQERNDNTPIDEIEIVEVDSISDDEIIKNDVKAFTFGDEQLFRFKIYKTDNETLLFVDFHHIITDGVSQRNLFADIANAYENKELSQEIVDGYVYSLIEEDTKNSIKYEESKEFFDEKLSQEIESTVLTPNLNGNPDDGQLKTIVEEIDSDRVKEFCNEHSLSQNAVFLSALTLTLNKYTFSDKTLITTIFNGRSNPYYYNTQGFLVKTLPLIFNNENRQATIKELIKDIDEVWKDTISHSEYPYTSIAEEYQLKPEFFFSYQEFLKSEEATLNGKTYEEQALLSEDLSTTAYKINFDIFVHEDRILYKLDYNDQLYSEEYIQKFLDSLNIILNQFIENDIYKLTVEDIELEKEPETITFTHLENPFIHKRFEKQVETNPDNIALVATDATLTNEELNIKANRIANALIRKGVNAKSNILIMLPRDSSLIAAIIGILKAGCAFIPIDLEYPKERIDYIYNNSQADYIITADGKSSNTLEINELLEEKNTSNPDIEITPDDLAYMIYTSGSTGNPKGVMISHKNACNEAEGNPKCEYNNLLSIATIAFDTSMEDILTGITNGIQIIFANDSEIKNIVDLTRLIKEHKPEVMEFTPSRLLSYLEVEEFCKVVNCAKCIVMGGEQFSAKAFNEVKKYCDAKVYNSYGPTEATIASNYKEITDPENITIGKALRNYVTEVRDIDGKLLPDGVMGELYIGGVGVGKGYYNMPDKTEEVFLEINNIPYYRSGDYAISRPDGDIEIHGRIDNQIKLRGLRIEIGEIESNINKYSSIKQAVVVIKKINNNDHLCAYYTADDDIDVDNLREFLKDKLTKYMIPTAYMQLDEIPQTPNGKTDLKSLPEPKLNLENIKPENEIEEKLFEIATELANTDQFGVTDDLYAIGFTSLILMKFNSQIYAAMGVNLDISLLFNEPTIRKLAIEIENSLDDASDLDEYIELANSLDYFPLTENQLGVYYECMQNPDEIKYTMPTLLRFDKDIEAEKLKESIIKTIEAHPYLKTRIITTEDGTLKQERNDNTPIDEIEIVEVDSISDDEIIKNDVKAFHFGDEQLFRFKIYQTKDETLLFLDFHHLITDGVSQINLLSDIANAYENRELSQEIVDGYVYSLIEENTKNSIKYEESKEFFNQKLSQEIESTVLTTNLNGNPDEGKMKTIVEEIDSSRVKEFCNEHSLSQNAVFLSALTLTLNKYTFSDKTLITTIFNGRSNPYYYHTQGFLVKTLPLIFNNENRQATINKFINDTDKVWRDTISHSEYPYTYIAEEYQLKPEFFFSYQEFLKSEEATLNGKTYEEQALLSEDLSATAYKINFDIYVTEDNIRFAIQYNDELYTEKYIKTFIDSMNTVLNQFIENNIYEFAICDVQLETPKEIPTFSPVETPFIHKRFEKQVETNPENIALVAEDATLTAEELNRKANRIANALIKRGVKPKNNVLVMLHRNSDLIASILGIIKAGCAYIPIDLEYPQDRIDYIYENSQADYIISYEDSDNSLNVKELLKETNTENPNVEITPDDLAYMIYTSGSTGNPKGVMISHENIANQVQNPKSQYNSLLCITTVSFDVSVDDILTSISNGIKLILANDNQIKNIPELTELIKEHKPEVADFTPSRLASHLEIEEFCEAIKCLKCLFLGGEQFSTKVYENFREYSDAIVYNSYGPTETTITSNNKEITDINDITVGYPLDNYITDVRDIDGKLLPHGVMGELYIGGVSVGKGYYNMPEKTEEVFLEINNIPYYRSGDYAISRPDGDIEIHGRIDNQIKLRGLRIEIGEIETNINKYPTIKQAVVVIKEINNNDHLCAYYTAEEEVESGELKEFLKDKLTKYMIPTAYMQLEEMPQTPNGKTDLKALPEPKLDLENIKPENETEQKLFEITSELIGTDQFGTTDELYVIGFTSLTLMKLNTLIFKEMNVNLDISVLFNSPTIKNLADEILSSDKANSRLSEFIEMSNSLEYFPLTENQLGIYYECMQSPGEVKYTLPAVARFDRKIDAEKLKESISRVIDAHPYLKARIVRSDDGSIKQYRNDNGEIDEIKIVKVDSITDEEIIKNDVKAFSLDNEQLFRFKIYETPDEIILFSDFHHIITDGESQSLLFEDIGKIYEDKEIEQEIVDGYTFSLIENDLQDSERYESAKKFFDDKLSQEIDSTVLTPDLNGNPEEGLIKDVYSKLDSDQINKFCLENSIGHNSLFMSALILTLNKFTYSDETLITTIFNGRTNPNYFNTQGFLVKTLPLIIKHENREQTIDKFLKSVDKTWIDSINNSIYPYTQIAEEYQLKPEIFYAYNEVSFSESLVINGEEYESHELSGASVATEYKIDISVLKQDAAIYIVISYNDQLYSEEYIKKFLDSIETVLDQFVNNDTQTLRICDVELETGKESPTFIPLENPIIHKRFEAQAELKPDDIALISNEKTYTYKELNELSNRVANGLIERGVEPGHNVLIMLPRTGELIASIIGILKAGCAFIPIDMEYPKERIEYIYENSQADYIIAGETYDKSLDIKELLETENVENPDVEVSPDDLAYMIYTSGSTGNPKGVMIGHENACNETEGNPKCEYNNLLSIATIAFDTSLEDILTGITNGIQIIFANDSEIKNIVDLIKLIKKYEPEVMEFTPSRLLSYLEVEEFCEAIGCAKCIVMGGEQFSAKAFNGVKEYCNAKVYNSYGPTEATIASNYKEITDPENITIGKALRNYVTDVRDIDGKLLPQGVMGELYIGGVGVGKGYYNMPEKTEEVYLTIDDIPYYRSGDYAIELPDGDIDIKGRIDNQIKLRGLRIEIGEIEANISRFPNIKHVVVVIKEMNSTDHLCAYFTAEEDIDIKLLKRYLQSKLTKYMVPTVFMQLDEIPQTPNGKTDVKALPDPSLALDLVEPETETEKKLYKLVSSLTSVEEFGITDDLYTLGFTSLTLMKLNSLIYNETDVNIEITDLFNNPTIQSLSDKIDNNIDAQIDIKEIIETSKAMDLFPLTSNQLGIYYECMQTEEIKYTMPSAIHFSSDVDPFKLKQAIIDTIEAHPYLKTRIVTTPEGELRQKRCDDVEMDEIEIVEVESITNEEMIENDVSYIPLDDSQLFRFKIYKTPAETVLFLDIHHIITDGVSIDLLFEDIVSVYNGGEIDEEIVDGFAYSLIEEELSENEVSKEYYKNKFAQGFESTVLTPNLNGNPEEADIKLVGDSIDSNFVRLFCQDHSISPNVLFMSATILALNKFTFSDKALITTIFNGRSNSNYYNTQGMLVKTIPIMVNSENRKMLIEDFIKVVDKTWKDSLVHSNYPYTKLSEEYQLKPEFFYAYHGAFETDNLELDGNEYTMEELDGTVATDYKINLDVYDDGEKIGIIIEYNDQIYTEDYVKKFLNAIKFTLVQFFVNDMDKLRLNEIELAPNFLPPEFEEVVNPFLHKRFEAQVAEKADEIALVASDDSLTYEELNDKANRIANALINKGVKPKSNILIMLPRTSDLIASIIGVLKAGCAFIPLDLKFPKERIEYIYENSQADYIINIDGLALNSLSINELLEEDNVETPSIELSPDDLAYMIYTSGSTGNPKGVMISHENACNQTEANPKCEYDNLLSIATIAFDTSLEDILTGITNGIKIIFANDDEIKSIVELIRLIKREKPEVMEFTPSRLLSYLEIEEFCEAIGCAKCIVMGGEQFSAKAFNGVKKYCDAKVYNSYGPTEITIASNYKEITDPENITIGKALRNYVTDVRDIDGKLLPQGVMGELYIGGVGVGKGYYNMPDKTEEVYLTIDDIPYYRSGDYAIELPDGDIDIKGRIDNQIKLRGLRIEIGEIETNISNFPNIKQNVVVIKEIRNNEHLCAYFTADEEINKDELKAYLGERLTQYMVPTVFMQIEEMPQTPNGKTDVKALPEPKLELNYVAPKNKLEQTICAIYSSILDIEIVGAEDNFFEIGGTSLIASKLIIELLKQDYNVKYDDIFRNQTPRALASFLSGDEISDDLDIDIIENYDYTMINNLLEKNTFESYAKGKNLELGNVLLTGVTGFMGIHVLYEYLKNEEGTIYCMMRKGQFDSCEERLMDLMDYYFDEDLSDLIGTRIILSEGDITSLDDFKKLENQPIDTIINCAAIVKHYTHDDYIFRVNVDGVVNGLEFAEANNITYVQISTTSVLDEFTEDTDLENIHCDERTLYWGQDLSNKYLNSKFLAERMVLEKALPGLNVKIIRVGNLMGRYSDGTFQKNFDTNAFLNNIKAIKNLKATIPAMSEDLVELSPIDYVAKATLALAKTPKESIVFHAVSDKLIPNRDIFDTLSSFGYTIDEVSPEEFIEIYEQNMDENIQGLITADLSISDFDFDEEDMESDYGEIVSLDQTLEILDSLGFEWPECDKDYLERVIKYLNEVNYFD